MNAPTRLGKYLLVERLHLGGIAELFLARATGLPGAEPLVALKRLLPTADDELIALFVDEAKIAAQLGHGNIVRVLEVGSEDDQYFMAQEYVSGRSLRALLQSPMAGGRPMPVEQAAYLACELCDGLDYAHRKKDVQGRDLNIIHRGVSPENLLLTYDGGVKLIDFGMAKAASSSHHTQAGSLKGKFGYMSPEQMMGEPLDRRSDIFSTGVVLFEMLTGVNPFVAESDLESMRRVAEAEVPSPRSYNAEIPAEIEVVLLKALSRNPADRYAWASDLRQALLPFTFADGASFSRQQLVDVMTTFFGEDAERDAERLQRAAEYREPPAQDAPPARVISPGMNGRAATPIDVPRPFDPAPLPFDFGESDEPDQSDRTQIVMAPSFPPVGSEAPLPAAPETPPEAPSEPPAPTRRTGSRTAIPAQRGSGTRAAGKRPTGSNPAIRRGTGSQPAISRGTGSNPAISRGSGVRPAVEVEPVPAPESPEEVTRPGFLVGPEVLASPEPPSAPTAPRETGGFGRFVRTPLGMLAIAAALLVVSGLAFWATRPSGPALSTVRVTVVPAEKAQVTIGGRLIEIGKPTQLPPGQYDLVARAPGFKQYLQRIAVFANEPESVFTVLLEPEAAPVATPPPAKPPPPEKPPEVDAPAKAFTARFVSVDPGVEIWVDGKSIGKTPDAEVRLPVGSAYRYEAKREGYEKASGLFGSSGEPSVTVTVALKKTPVRPAVHHTAPRHPRPSGQGGLVCSSVPAGAKVVIDGKATKATTPIYPDSPLMLPVGKHRVVFTLDGKKSAPHTVTVEKDKLVFLKDVVIAGAKSGGGGLDSPEMMTP